MKKLLIGIFLLSTSLHLSAQVTGKERLEKYVAFEDSLRKIATKSRKDIRSIMEAKIKADTKITDSREGLSLSLFLYTYTFKHLELIDQYVGKGKSSGVYPGLESLHVIPANEDLLYSYLKPFAKWLKKGAIYNQEKQPEPPERVSLNMSVYADLAGNIQTLVMWFHESMPIPFDECVLFYKKMTSGELKLTTRSGHDYAFQEAKYLHFRISLDPKPEVIQKIESAVGLE